MNGIIGIIEDKRNFTFGSNVEFPKLKKTFEDFKIQYNQNEVSLNCCTVTSAMTGISNLTGLTFSLSERKEIWEKAKELGASDDNGWYIDKAVKLVIEYVKEKWQKEFIYVSLPLRDSRFQQILDAGYPIITGFGGTGEYGSDIRDNGIINGTYTGKPTYYHCMFVS